MPDLMGDSVPTINLCDAEQDPAVLVPLDRACHDHGFFLLENHGMQTAIDDMWQAILEPVPYD